MRFSHGRFLSVRFFYLAVPLIAFCQVMTTTFRVTPLSSFPRKIACTSSFIHCANENVTEDEGEGTYLAACRLDNGCIVEKQSHVPHSSVPVEPFFVLSNPVSPHGSHEHFEELPDV